MLYRDNELEQLVVNLYYAILANTKENGRIDLQDLDGEITDVKDYLIERNKI